jgi:cell division protein FtsX
MVVSEKEKVFEITLMRKLFLYILRNIWQIKARSFLIIVVVASSVSVYAGTYMGLDIIGYTARTLYRELNLSDYQIVFIPVTEDEMPNRESLESIQGVKGLIRD